MSLGCFQDLDIVTKIMEYESGGMNETEVIEFFQHLLDENIISAMQGSYQRTASELLEAGYIE